MTNRRYPIRGQCFLAAAVLLGVFVSCGRVGDTGEREVTLHLEEGTNMSAAASPDGKWIAIDLLEDLWLVPAEGGEARRLTSEPSTERDPRRPEQET